MKYYINHKHETFGTETIDEAETKEEALYLLKEYRLNGATFYISKRAIY